MFRYFIAVGIFFKETFIRSVFTHPRKPRASKGTGREGRDWEREKGGAPSFSLPFPSPLKPWVSEDGFYQENPSSFKPIPEQTQHALLKETLSQYNKIDSVFIHLVMSRQRNTFYRVAYFKLLLIISLILP